MAIRLFFGLLLMFGFVNIHSDARHNWRVDVDFMDTIKSSIFYLERTYERRMYFTRFSTIAHYIRTVYRLLRRARYTPGFVRGRLLCSPAGPINQADIRREKKNIFSARQETRAGSRVLGSCSQQPKSRFANENAQTGV